MGLETHMLEITLSVGHEGVQVDEPAQLTGVDSAETTRVEAPEADGAFMWMGAAAPGANQVSRRVEPPPLPGAPSEPIVVEDDWILIGAEARELEVAAAKPPIAFAPEPAADVPAPPVPMAHELAAAADAGEANAAAGSLPVADGRPSETARPSSGPGRKRDSFEPVWTSAPSAAAGRATDRGVRAWARRQSLGLAIGLGCGVIMGAVSFGPGRAFDRAGGTAQPAPAAAFRGSAVDQASPETKPAREQSAMAPDESLAAVADALDAPTDWEDDLAAEVDTPAGASPFAGAPAVTLPTGETPELVAGTVELLDTGRFDAALIWGRALVATAPDDAVGYLCLGSALLDLGRRQEAHEVFRSCVRHATHGDVSECLTFAGRH